MCRNFKHACLQICNHRHHIVGLFFERSNAFLFGPNYTQPRKTSFEILRRATMHPQIVTSVRWQTHQFHTLHCYRRN